VALQHDELCAKVMANHFPAARIDGTRVWTGVADLAIDCEVSQIRDGARATAALVFGLHGERFAQSPVYVTVVGYGSGADDAIIAGTCNWACTFGPMFVAAFGGEVSPELESMAALIDGERYTVYIDGLDRAAMVGGVSPASNPGVARARLGGTPWLAPGLIASGTLPDWGRGVAVLSVFVADSAEQRIVEVKLNGEECEDAQRTLEGPLDGEPGVTWFLRELAVLVPSAP
jgi:hypothetical protein